MENFLLLRPPKPTENNMTDLINPSLGNPLNAETVTVQDFAWNNTTRNTIDAEANEIAARMAVFMGGLK